MLPHVVESFFRTRHINLEVPQLNVLMLKKKGQWKSNDRGLVVGCEIVLCTVLLFSSQLFFSQMFWDDRRAQRILFFAIPSCRLRWTPYFLAAFQKAVNNLHDLLIQNINWIWYGLLPLKDCYESVVYKIIQCKFAFFVFWAPSSLMLWKWDHFK